MKFEYNEHDLWECIASGHTPTEIAEALNISRQLAEYYVKKLRRKAIKNIPHLSGQARPGIYIKRVKETFKKTSKGELRTWLVDVV